MKLVLFTCLICIFFEDCHTDSSSYTKSTDLIQQNLRGRVERLELTSYTVDSLGDQHLDSAINMVEFDRKGYATLYVNKTASGKLTMNETVSRYENEAVREFSNVIGGKLVSKLVLDIDKNGKYCAVRTYDSSGRQDSYYTDLAENKFGIVYTAKQHFMNGKIESAFDLKYDKANNIESKYTDSAGKITYSASSKLNESGDPIEQASTTMENNSPRTDTITYKYVRYDSNDNWIERTTSNSKGKPTKIEKRSLTYYQD